MYAEKFTLSQRIPTPTLVFQQFLKCQATRGRAHNKDYSAQEDIQVALVLNGGFFIGLPWQANYMAALVSC